MCPCGWRDMTPSRGPEILTGRLAGAVLLVRGKTGLASDGPRDNDARGDERASSELSGVVGGERDEEKGDRTEPSTRFALSLAASFLRSRRNLDGVRGGVTAQGGVGRRSGGTKPAGNLVMCMELGRRCRGRHGGVGRVGGWLFWGKRWAGT